MNVCYACNQNFNKYLFTSIYSLLYNNENLVEKIYLLYNEYSEKDLKMIFDLTQKYHVKFFPIKVDYTELENFKLTHHFTIETYFRLLIDKYIVDEKILYLDADTVIDGNLTCLEKINIDDYLLAAVENLGISTEYKKNVLMGENKTYFNAGLIIMNLKLIRQGKLFDKVINFINLNPHRINYVDQDALNAVINGDFLKLSQEFNTLTYRGKVDYDPIILHYAGGTSKPLKKSINNTYHYIFLNYFKQTPYYKFIITETNYMINNVVYIFYYKLKLIIKRGLVACLKKEH